ncbi:protogenin-like protein [Leptotrombidium deliense]|uniref:Protogenin-like protein n=1 Tax=Leptotrombidium deliense TaxID=299467 RepID=A0A443SAK0_9ACAR|nr:protogenin-like protein [Leptotrombidium deliense]
MEGLYRCISNNTIRFLRSNAVNLTVNDEEIDKPLQFLSTSVNVIKKTKEEIIFECLLNQGKERANVVWFRQSGKPLVKQRFKVLNESSLLVANIVAEDEDVYKCNATLHDITLSQQNILTVHTPPMFITKPENIVKPNAQTARFECTVLGSPQPMVRWMKNGEIIVTNGRIKIKPDSNSLVISQTISSDSGVYQCVAENDVGIATVAARLLVNASSNLQPKPPYNLRAYTVSSTAIELTWQPGDSPNGLIIHAFTIHYTPTEGGFEVQKVAVNTSVIIDKLKPYTNYTFYARAYNERSASEQSEYITHMTGEDTPIAIPKAVCTPLSSTSLLISWNLLPPQKARGKIVASVLHYRKHSQASYRVFEVQDGNVLETTLNNLEPGEEYDVRVLSSTSVGYPRIADDSELPWTRIKMPSSDIDSSLIPLKLHLVAINSTSIKVNWSFPRNSSESRVHGFHLLLRQHSKPISAPIKLPAHTYEYLFTNLESETWYEVHLSLLNENDTELVTSVQNIITLPQRSKIDVNGGRHDVFVPIQPPVDLDAHPLSSTSISFTWKHVTQRTAMYTVRYQRAHLSAIKNETANYSVIHSTKNVVTIGDLRPYTVYEFSVCAHDTNNNQGPFSAKIVCKTMEGVPTEPRSLSGFIIDAHSVRLTWEPPEHANGIITGYQVLYSTVKLDNEYDKWSLKEEKTSQLTSFVYNLSSNTQYYFCTRAMTQAGSGPPSALLTIFIPTRSKPAKPGRNQELVVRQTPTMQYIGVVIGLEQNDRTVSEEGKELESFTTLLSDGFVDTKGGYNNGYTGIRLNGHSSVINGAHCYRDNSQTSSLPLLNNHNNTNGYCIREDYRTVPLSSRLHQTQANLNDKPCDSSTSENNAPGRPF